MECRFLYLVFKIMRHCKMVTKRRASYKSDSQNPPFFVIRMRWLNSSDDSIDGNDVDDVAYAAATG
jgi:hypothetical protein